MYLGVLKWVEQRGVQVVEHRETEGAAGVRVRDPTAAAHGLQQRCHCAFVEPTGQQHGAIAEVVGAQAHRAGKSSKEPAQTTLPWSIR
ncbi:MAG: hypothetical protein ACI9MC_000737 [Kiritimatiellia bacterium]|jgi:hypothetical protein